MTKLYDTGIIILPDGRRRTIQQIIDVLTLHTLTPQKMDWVKLMVRQDMERNFKNGTLEISPGMYDYAFRQITFYVLDAMLGDQKILNE